jgi:hypothetical protein
MNGQNGPTSGKKCLSHSAVSPVTSTGCCMSTAVRAMAAAAADVVRLSAMGTGLQKTMTSLFGYNEFRGDQVDVMESIIAGESLAWLHMHARHVLPSRDARTTLQVSLHAIALSQCMLVRAARLSRFVPNDRSWPRTLRVPPPHPPPWPSLRVPPRT